MKTCAAKKTLREEPVGGKALGNFQSDTTSEPQIGNGLPGAPVRASMSGSAMQNNQGGTVEYFVSHP